MVFTRSNIIVERAATMDVTVFASHNWLFFNTCLGLFLMLVLIITKVSTDIRKLFTKLLEPSFGDCCDIEVYVLKVI